MNQEDLLLSSYNYELPEEQIAQIPSIPAHTAKLLICSQNQNGSYSFSNNTFENLPNKLNKKHILFLNKTKVFKARVPLHGIKIERKSGKTLILGKGEIFIYHIISKQKFECLVSDSKNFKPGSKIFFNEKIFLESLSFTENGILFKIHGNDIFSFLEEIGEMPLPPYIKYEKEKEQRYQTFFAEEIGSAAAPTASLHFTPFLIKKLEKRGINLKYLCLHVGLGTFKPVHEEQIEKQKLHFEPMIIPHNIRKEIMTQKKKKKIFVPVGTTMVRYLESLPYIRIYLKEKHYSIKTSKEVSNRWNNLTKDIPQHLVDEFIPQQNLKILEDNSLIIHTKLFIRPGINFYLTDELITNFHLPKSSLMMLVSAFMGRENLLKGYEKAIKKNYKFYSFGDGMRIKKLN